MSGFTMLLCSASAATTKRSISACDNCFEGFDLAIAISTEIAPPEEHNPIPVAACKAEPDLYTEEQKKNKNLVGKASLSGQFRATACTLGTAGWSLRRL
ncbi:hypothetical protein [Mesorhizobium sp. 113-1-2]|uniref:hypothetical protein n=1 Tax=Mesorhizobium sp. 113-1-2 TaxID=2744515 RepID=UPI0019293B25|nr:hypothetical protein [Mesorhizobium sp. 113-1-2]